MWFAYGRFLSTCFVFQNAIKICACPRPLAQSRTNGRIFQTIREDYSRSQFTIHYSHGRIPFNLLCFNRTLITQIKADERRFFHPSSLQKRP